MAPATINLTSVIVVFIHVVIMLMGKTCILGEVYCLLQINNEDIVKLLWCIIGVEDDGFVSWEVAFSVMFAVVHEDMIC